MLFHYSYVDKKKRNKYYYLNLVVSIGKKVYIKMQTKLLKRSWIEISIPTLIKNTQLYENQIQNNSSIMAVVKADAYGHGAVEVSRALQYSDITDFAVSNILEAIELREAGIKGQILILGYSPIEELELLSKHNITQAIISSDYANDLISSNLPIKCQYAIDTGMNRIGLDADDVERCEKEIRRVAEKLELTGLFTHLCVADTPSEDGFTSLQQEKFKRVVETVKDLNLPYIHSLNSAGGLWHQDGFSNLNRLGIIMYGLKPDYMNSLPTGIEPVMEWKSVVSMIKTVHPGEAIGYGRTYKAQKEMRIATIPTGYADGYNRALSNKGYVLINGKKAPIVGRVRMDQFMVDITDIPDVKAYDEVVLIGKSGDEMLSADDMAQMLGTIGYEVVCDVGKRVQRIYL